MIDIQIADKQMPKKLAHKFYLPESGISCHSQGANIGHMLQSGLQVIGRDGIVSCDANHRGASVNVILTSTYWIGIFVKFLLSLFYKHNAIK